VKGGIPCKGGWKKETKRDAVQDPQAASARGKRAVSLQLKKRNGKKEEGRKKQIEGHSWREILTNKKKEGDRTKNGKSKKGIWPRG